MKLFTQILLFLAFTLSVFCAEINIQGLHKRTFSPFLFAKMNEQVLLEPFHYLVAHPGKEIRSKLIQAFDHWIQVPQEKLAQIKEIIEMLHTASLLIDDVQDGSDLRRGVPVAHKIYGVPSTINCANYVYFLALEKVTNTLNSQPCVETFTQELLQLHRGQGMELYWRDAGICPTEKEYLEMVGNKTGGLLRLAVKLMQILGESKVDYVPLVNLLGIHFQIRDDLYNLKSKTYTDNKGFAEDLTEGKFSFPIIHSIRTDTSNRELLNILSKRTQDTDLKKYAVTIMEKTRSFEYTKQVLSEYEGKARVEIERLGGNPVLSGVLDYLKVGN